MIRQRRRIRPGWVELLAALANQRANERTSSPHLTVSPSFIVMQIEPTIMAPTQMFITSPKTGLRRRRVSNECARW